MRGVLLICIALFAGLTDAMAQNVGLGARAGLNISHVTDFEQDAKPGFHAGTYVKIPLQEGLWLQPELIFSQKGSSSGLKDQRIYYSPFDDAFYRRRKLTLHYTDLLVPVRYDISKGFHFLAGPGVSVLVESLYKYNNGNDGRDRFEFANAQKFDIVAHAGLGYEFESGLMIGVRAETGFRPVFEDNPGMRNYLVQMTVGFTLPGMTRSWLDDERAEEGLPETGETTTVSPY